jgi:hypothetical protein
VEPETEPEKVCVVPVSEQYLKWVEERHPKPQEAVSPDTVGITPELTRFLNWMSKKERKTRSMEKGGLG